MVEQPVAESSLVEESAVVESTVSYMCINSDAGAVDSAGGSCVSYDSAPETCGTLDTEDFFAATYCCACGGGDQSGDAAPAAEEPEPVVEPAAIETEPAVEEVVAEAEPALDAAVVEEPAVEAAAVAEEAAVAE